MMQFSPLTSHFIFIVCSSRLSHYVTQKHHIAACCNMTWCNVTQCDKMQCHETASVESCFYVRKFLSKNRDVHSKPHWPAVDVHCHDLSHLDYMRTKCSRNKLRHTNTQRAFVILGSYFSSASFLCFCTVFIHNDKGSQFCGCIAHRSGPSF